MLQFKNAIRSGPITCVPLLQYNSQQLISQYVDDTSFPLRAEEASVYNLVGILHNFGLDYGLEINWHKNVVYCCGQITPTRLGGELSLEVGCKWRSIKAIWHPFFGLHMKLKNVDIKFLTSHWSVMESNGTYNLEDILQLNIWWKMEHLGIYFGITIWIGLLYFVENVCITFVTFGSWYEWVFGLGGGTYEIIPFIDLLWFEGWVQGCLADLELNPLHMNGLVYIDSKRMSCPSR